MFFPIYLERSIKGVKILKLSEKVIDKLNYNPFALQLLATNSKDNLEKNLRELVEYEMYDHSTVSKIAAVLDITNALTDEEKSLLFKASLFLNMNISQALSHIVMK
ncbi:MAG: hypothetical protein IPJ39_22810 [Saprospiraceae bacterium]|nr:hypothetical protein [Saprospiraceae bacterium]